MRNLILLFFVIPLLSLDARLRDSVKVKSPIYEIVYSEKLQQPKSVKYTVLCPNGTASRTGMDFYTVDSIRTSDDLDYADNLYDKGHMAPAADFNCTKEMLHLTFSYINCALQDQYLNRGLWKDLETHERNLAEKDTIDVAILIVFTSKSMVLSTGATVPDGFYKTITLRKARKSYKYYFPNKKPEKKTIAEYLVKVK